MAHSPARPRRRFFQFRLRTLLGLMLLIVLLLGAWRLLIEPYQRQGPVMALVEELGGRCQTSAAAPWVTQLLRRDNQDIVFIDLSDCDEPVEYVGAVSRLPLLETLVVGGEKFTDDHLRQFQRLHSLRWLVLDSTSVTETALGEFRLAMPKVDVYQSQRRAEAEIRDRIRHHTIHVVERGYDESYPRLRELLGDEHFAHTTWLRFSRFYRAIDQADIAIFVHASSVRRMPHLRKLEIDHLSVTDADIEQFKALPNLLLLSLGRAQVTDDGLRHLESMRQLEELWLHDNDITDAGLKHLEHLPNLRGVFLFYTKVTDQGLSRLGRMTRLERLWLHGTQVSDAGLKHLHGLTNLREMTLHDTKVTRHGVTELRRVLPNCVVEHD
jgi:hypothetical protein